MRNDSGGRKNQETGGDQAEERDQEKKGSEVEERDRDWVEWIKLVLETILAVVRLFGTL